MGGPPLDWRGFYGRRRARPLPPPAAKFGLNRSRRRCRSQRRAGGGKKSLFIEKVPYAVLAVQYLRYLRSTVRHGCHGPCVSHKMEPGGETRLFSGRTARPFSMGADSS